MTKISTKKITERIHQAVVGKSGDELKKTIDDIVEFLTQKSLLSKSPEILARLEKALDADSGTVRAKLSSRRPLTASEISLVTQILKDRYTSHHVILDSKEEPALLGGVKIEVNDEVIDFSLRNKVQQLQTSLLSAD